MKFQILFSGEIISSLSSAEFAQKVEMSVLYTSLINSNCKSSWSLATQNTNVACVGHSTIHCLKQFEDKRKPSLLLKFLLSR